MALEGTQEPELLAKARGRLCSLLQVEQDTAVGSSFSGFSSVPEVNSNPACTLRDGRGRAERAPVGCGIRQPGSQSSFCHSPALGLRAKHSRTPETFPASTK